MSDDAKTRFLAELQRRHWSRPEAAAWRAGFGRIPASYYEAAEDMCATDEYTTILHCIHNLMVIAVERAEARSAERRCHGLRLAPDLSATPTTTKECAP